MAHYALRLPEYLLAYARQGVKEEHVSANQTDYLDSKRTGAANT